MSPSTGCYKRLLTEDTPKHSLSFLPLPPWLPKGKGHLQATSKDSKAQTSPLFLAEGCGAVSSMSRVAFTTLPAHATVTMGCELPMVAFSTSSPPVGKQSRQKVQCALREQKPRCQTASGALQERKGEGTSSTGHYLVPEQIGKALPAASCRDIFEGTAHGLCCLGDSAAVDGPAPVHAQESQATGRWGKEGQRPHANSHDAGIKVLG